jgi:hypothetical protein
MPELEQPSKEVVSSVLSFYSSQLTSHTSMIVGFIVAFFTLIQVRGSVASGAAQWLLQLGALTIATAAVYSMFRVVLYGSLSGVLTHFALDDYGTFSRGQKVKLFEHALVNGFATSQILNNTTVRSRFYKLRGHDSHRAGGWVTFWVQPPMILSVVVAMIVVGVMFGWPADTFAEVLGVMILFVSILIALSLRFAGPLRKRAPTSQ